MLGSDLITLAVNRKQLTLPISTILYVRMERNSAEIHTVGGEIYRTRLTLAALKKQLGSNFLKIGRSLLVSVMAVHELGESIELTTGELLPYPPRNKKVLLSQLHKRQKAIIDRVHETEDSLADDFFLQHYGCFDALPIAFADIEMLFNDKRHAVDWRFCYANQALATLENVPLPSLINATFSSIFSNMNRKWLRLYECAVLYGETLEVIDHSPEIDTDLRVVCFPTFKGHCGCLLFPVTGTHFIKISPDAPAVLMNYFRFLLNTTL